MESYKRISHTFEPVWDEHSEILILGTFPSVKSRENLFYYGHPQNRFWKVLAALTSDELPRTVPEKKAFLLRNHIAVWDVIAECDIVGSSDSSIKNVTANDMSIILNHAPINGIFANGAKAYELYMKYCFPQTQRKITKLPSTSPANAAWNMERLAEEWEKYLMRSRKNEFVEKQEMSFP
ncbi:MAG: DNA-deoxyinosine glycosylase [Clostridiales bacterium]|nr:DNA-deoxyinosine glycosylase [Clostridiales bacterium]